MASLFGKHLKVNNVWKISNNCCSFILDNLDSMSKQLPEKRSKQNIRRIIYVRLAILTNTCTQNCQPHDWQLVWQFIVILFNLERIQYSFPALWFKPGYDKLTIFFRYYLRVISKEVCPNCVSLVTRFITSHYWTLISNSRKWPPVSFPNCCYCVDWAQCYIRYESTVLIFEALMLSLAVSYITFLSFVFVVLYQKITEIPY